MKTIIVCTDFSPNASTAVHYAAALAHTGKCRLILFHHYDYPVPATDMPTLYPAVFIDGLEADLEKKLLEIKAELNAMYPIEVTCILRSLTLHSDLEQVFKEEQADLV